MKRPKPFRTEEEWLAHETRQPRISRLHRFWRWLLGSKSND